MLSPAPKPLPDMLSDHILTQAQDTFAQHRAQKTCGQILGDIDQPLNSACRRWPGCIARPACRHQLGSRLCPQHSHYGSPMETSRPPCDGASANPTFCRALLPPPASAGKQCVGDVSVIHPGSATVCSAAAKTDSGAATLQDADETSQYWRYGAGCYQLVPVTLETCSRLGRPFMAVLISYIS
jgi:hypothetical protein